MISIHALVKRATSMSPSVFSLVSYFNPRPREEGDDVISLRTRSKKNFNPRPREEGDEND